MSKNGMDTEIMATRRAAITVVLPRNFSGASVDSLADDEASCEIDQSLCVDSPAIDIFQSHDVVLTEIGARLNFDEFEWYFSRVAQSM